MISSNEIVTLINALGLDAKAEKIDPKKDLRYERIIIMTDADVDGSHIRALLLTFFNNKPFNKLIQNGNVYLAQPPLFKINKGSKSIYLKDEPDLEKYILNNSKLLQKVNKKSINKVILVGHVGNSPDVRYTKEGRAVATFSLATHELKKNPLKEGVEHTEWHNILAWGNIGEFAEQYVKKGQLLCVEGRLRTGKWVSKEGVSLSKTEIVANSIVPLDWKP